MSLFLQHIETLYANGKYSKVKEELHNFEKTNKPFPNCIYREIAYAESSTYRIIRDENIFPIRFLWFFELKEQIMMGVVMPLERSHYNPESLYERWLRCLNDESFRQEAEKADVLIDLNEKAISLTRGWVLIGDSFIEDLMEIETYWGEDLLVIDEKTKIERPLFIEYKSKIKQNTALSLIADVSTKHEYPTIQAKRVRYIKLGREGVWEKEGLEKGIIRFGYGSATDERFSLCLENKWDDLTKSFIEEGKDKGTATRFTNETRLFFEDDGTTLWITFVCERLYWGFLKPDPAEKHQDGDGVFRRLKDGWRWLDLRGEPLAKDRLSGALTKLAAYRGTSCYVDVAEYAVRRINGQKMPEVERAMVALEEMKSSVLEMIRLLGPKDFETLVDLIFSISGWRRQGIVGKTQKTLDLDLALPSTGERAFVQVKSKTNSLELADYVAKFDELDSYNRMFFVYHSGKAETDDERVTVIGPEKLAEMAVDAGLATWLIRKVS